MIVKIDNYGEKGENYFVEYKVSELSLDQMNFLKDNLSEECEIAEDI